jgi:SHS2 domain-containing protein
MPYEYLDHQADLGIRGMGATPQEAFSQGAQAMLTAMANVDFVHPTTEFVQHCAAPDLPTLFVEWLNELLYQREVNDVLFASAQVTHMSESDTGWVLDGVAKGAPLDLEHHEIYTEVKAATYAGLDCHKEGDLWIVQCVIDL